MGWKCSAWGGEKVEGWLTLTLPGRNDPLILECLSTHRLSRARGAPSPPYEFITRSPSAQRPLTPPSGQPLEFLFQSGGEQMQGYLLLRQVAADGSRLRFETTERGAGGRQGETD